MPVSLARVPGASLSVLAASFVAATVPATAQTQTGLPNQLENERSDAAGDIVVTGIKGGLDRALNIKRDASSIVDVISAEDVGKFPDVNVAESVQRISGVQINRVRGEGRTVNIRGLPANFTLATFNGRLLPNAISNQDASVSRSFDFTLLPPEFIRTLAVYKAPTADLEDGGLAGLVDVRTPRPFDTNRRILALSAQAELETNSGKWAPRVSGFFSDQFADGRLGVSLGLSYTHRKPETHALNAGYITTTEASGIPTGQGPDDLNGNGIIDNGKTIRIPSLINLFNYQEDNERLSAIASVQFKASDSLTLSLDGFYSKTQVYAVTNENLNLFSSAAGVIASETADIGGVETATLFRVRGLDYRANGRVQDRTGSVFSLVGGVDYEGEGFKARVEGSYALSRQVRDNVTIAAIANGDAEYAAQSGDTLGSIRYLNGFDAARLDPNSFRVASINGEYNLRNRDRAWDLKLDAEKQIADRGLTALKFGAHYVNRAIYQDNSRITVGAPGVSALYGGLPAGPIPGSVSAAPFMKRREPGSGSYLGSYGGNAVFPGSWLTADTQGLLNGLTEAQVIAAGSLTNDPTGITDVQERTLAGYGRADLGFGALTGNLGLRVVKTWQETVGVSPDLNGITVLADAGAVTRVPTAAPLTVKRSYIDFLPSLNLKFEATDRLQFRFAASRTMSRPTLTEISPTTTAVATGRTVTQNNPNLDPFRSNNLDLTAEFYFQKDAAVGASLFYKDIKSLIRRETTIQSLPVTYIYANGTQVQTPIEFAVSRLVNGSGVSVKGFEVYYQQAFTQLPAPFDGLGTILNYTYIKNSDPTQLTAASKHNYNITGYYEKGPVGVRLSYSWRSDFLSSVGVAPALNQYTEAFGTLDGSINVKLKNGISLVVEAVNILDRDERITYEGGLPSSYTDAGRRLFVGARLAI